MFFIQLIWWIRTHQIFKKFDQTKMFQILLYTLLKLLDSTNLIDLIWPCITGDLSIVDWFKQLSFLKVLSFFVSSPVIFFQKSFLWFSVITQFALLALVNTVMYPGHLGACYTGLGSQTLAHKKGFLTYLKIFFKHPRRRVFRYSIYVI